MDIMKLATGLLAQKLGGNNAALGGALNNLLGSGDKADLGGLVAGLKEKGLGDVAESWLGDGENEEISTDQLKEVLDSEKVSQAAAELGTDENTLLESLKDAIPQMVDKSSNGGSLLDSVGGLGAIAKKFL